MTLEEHPLLGMALFVAGGTSLTMGVALLAVSAGPLGVTILVLSALCGAG